MQLILIVLLLTFLFARGYIRDDCYCGISNSDSRRITMGVQTKPFKYPWMVLMFSSHNKPYCGGALVSDSLVLSAAHCFSFTWEFCVSFVSKNSILFYVVHQIQTFGLTFMAKSCRMTISSAREWTSTGSSFIRNSNTVNSTMIMIWQLSASASHFE